MNYAALAEKHPNVPMMRGTQHHLDYMVFARKGKILLGIKPNHIADGAQMGVPGHTYVGAKLRSAWNRGYLPDEESAVVPMHLNPSNAWPEVTWENENEERSSTQIGVFFKGTFTNDPDVLMEQIGNGKLARQMMEYLVGVAGEDHLVIPKAEIESWLNDFYDPIIQKVNKKIELQKAVTQEVQQSVGSFGMQAAIIKKVYDKKKEVNSGPGTPVEDADDGDWEEGDEE